MSKTKYLVEVRDAKGALDFKKEVEMRKEHPYLFSKSVYTIDDLCYYVSYGKPKQGPSGPKETHSYLQSIGISVRVKTW